MSIDVPRITREHSPAQGRWVATTSAALTIGNLVVAFTALFIILERDQDELLPQDVWAPFALALTAQAALNGLLMLALGRTRRIGLDILAGTLAGVLLFAAWLWFGVLPNFA